jgi:hypothetical protein
MWTLSVDKAHSLRRKKCKSANSLKPKKSGKLNSEIAKPGSQLTKKQWLNLFPDFLANKAAESLLRGTQKSVLASETRPRTNG